MERFLFISTDKAVRPTSVMGASKRLGEGGEIFVLSEEQLQGLKHLSTDGDITAMLGKIKELIPVYTGWPRQQKGKGSEAKPRGSEAEPRKTKGELGEEAA